MTGPMSALTAHVVQILVTGPCATATAALIQSVADGAVLATDIVTDVPEAPPVEVGAHSATVMGVGSFTAVDGTRLLLFGTPGADRGWEISSALRDEVDAVIFVVDADAAHTHSEAGVTLRSLAVGLRVPLVVAVNRSDDPAQARTLARSLGVPSGARVSGCQLIDPRSGRDVVIEALDALLASLDPESSERQVA
jgi:signal recognition particle receptor subunit beta